MLTGRVSWNDTDGKYFIQYRIKGNVNWITPTPNNPTINSFYDIENLVEGITYEFKVTTLCCDESEDIIVEYTTPCSPISNLNILIQGTNGILTWNNVSWAVSYTVKYKVSTSSVYINAPNSPVTSPTTQIPGLVIGTTYDFQVIVNCRNGVSIPINKQSTPTCPNIGGLNVVFVNNTANLTWNSTTTQTFKVEYKKTSDSTWIVHQNGITQTNSSITGLDYGINYDFRVTAFCGLIQANILTQTIPSPCPSVTDLVAENI